MMKYKILKKNQTLKTFRTQKKRHFKRMKKLMKQLLRLKVKEKVFLSFFKDYLAPGCECPVLLEGFSPELPPYKLSSCEHRITSNVLQRLPIKDISKKHGSAYMKCPLCRNIVLFAHLDNSYLQAIQVWKKIKEIENLDFSDLFKSIELSDEPKKKLSLVYFNPTGGVLDHWEKLSFRS